MNEEPTERIEPAPLEVALLYKILKAQQETLEFLKSITSEGVDVPIPDQTVTDITTVHFITGHPYHPLRSIDLLNKGPSTVYYLVNKGKEIELEDRESVKIQRPRPTIEYIIFRVISGQTTTVQLVGHY